MNAFTILCIACFMAVAGAFGGYAYGTMTARPPVETVTDAACRIGTNHAVEFVRERWGSDDE